MYHGDSDHEHAADLALRLNGSSQATDAHLKYLAIVAGDMVATSWPVIERVARALLERQTLKGSEISTILSPPRPKGGIRVLNLDEIERFGDGDAEI